MMFYQHNPKAEGSILADSSQAARVPRIKDHMTTSTLQQNCLGQ